MPAVFVIQCLRNLAKEDYVLESIIKLSDTSQSRVRHIYNYFLSNGAARISWPSAQQYFADFLVKALRFREFHKLFDDPHVDGLRFVANAIKMSKLLKSSSSEWDRWMLQEDNVEPLDAVICMLDVLKTYFRSDFFLKFHSLHDELARLNRHNPTFGALPLVPAESALDIKEEDFDLLREFLLQNVPLNRNGKDRIARFVDYDGVKLLLTLLIVARHEFDRNMALVHVYQLALSVLEMLVFHYKAQLAIADFHYEQEEGVEDGSWETGFG